jgi:hypothetical protein
MKAAFLAAAVLATAGVAFYFSTTVDAAKASGPGSAELKPAAHKTLSSKSLSLPMFFEPNQGQTAPQVKFLAHGAGYGLFLTADEAVLQLQSSAVSTQHSAVGSQRAPSSVIRMHLDGANSSARVSGASPLPGKSSYFIGNDPSKWHRDIPQFARVQYEAVYPGVDLVYYGDQGQLEYDFHVAPAADPNQIALGFKGASARIDSDDSGDLILSTASGDVRFHAPRVYQPAASQSGNDEKAIAGSFRQLADNKVGFTIGTYDHSRELVIDPVLSYSTYLGGSKTEAQVKIAVDSAPVIYVAGATDSPDFPVTDGSSLNPTPGAQNIFISKINPTLAGTAQLVYSIYLGGSGTDSLSGIAVDAAFSIYVAGSTTSSDFPTVNGLPGTVTGGVSHGFLSKLMIPGTAYGLAYSTYLAGNGVDHVTGLAIDTSQLNAYVTGDTTSTNPASDNFPFPANPNAFQRCPFGPVLANGTCPVASGPPQFFASQINTGRSGSLSMLYSTYFGGGNPAGATAVGGGIAVDPSPNSTPNMYITGTTNMLPTVGGNGEAKFPLFNAQQSCLNEASNHGTCTGTNGTNNTDAFVAKINPNQPGSSPVYSTYVGGGGSDVARAIAVDTSGMAYITGSTNSTDWVCSCAASPFQGAYGGGATDAFIVKIGNLTGSIFPLTYFTYLGGNLDDIGNDIKVDAVQGAHVVGSTTSTNFPTTLNTLQSVPGGGGDAFVASIGTTLSGVGNGDLSTYLGGNQLDQGTGIDIDIFGATYVAGNTLSPNFPTKNPYQGQLNGGSQDAFVTKIGADSKLVLSNAGTSPAPNPVAAGTPVAFTFDILNQGPDNASNVTFLAIVPIVPVVASNATAKVTSGSGSCGPLNGNTIQCLIPTLSACIEPLCTSPVAAVEVDVTPSITDHNPTISVSGSVSANGGGTQGTSSQTANIVDFSIAASTSTPTINAGDTATFQVVFAPTSNLGYNATITPSQSISSGMVTATTPTFNPTTVTLSGTASATTTLSIATVARPVVTGTLLRRGAFYAAWLPIGGLSLVGLGLGASRKRRRWLAAALLCLMAGAVLLQSGCGSSSSTTTTGSGTQPGTYTITISGSAATGASHSTQVALTVR